MHAITLVGDMVKFMENLSSAVAQSKSQWPLLANTTRLISNTKKEQRLLSRPGKIGRPRTTGSTPKDATPFFKLADKDLKEITGLLKTLEGFQRGVTRLSARVTVGTHAATMLEDARQNSTASKEQMDAWAEQVRRGLPFLESRLKKKVEGAEKRKEATDLLDMICDDGYAATSFRPAMRANPSYKTPNTIRSEQKQGEEFGLGHDLGEQKGGNIAPGDIFTPSDAPGRQPKKEASLGVAQAVALSSQALIKGTTREGQLPSNIIVRDFASMNSKNPKPINPAARLVAARAQIGAALPASRK